MALEIGAGGADRQPQARAGPATALVWGPRAGRQALCSHRGAERIGAQHIRSEQIRIRSDQSRIKRGPAECLRCAAEVARQMWKSLPRPHGRSRAGLVPTASMSAACGRAPGLAARRSCRQHTALHCRAVHLLRGGWGGVPSGDSARLGLCGQAAQRSPAAAAPRVRSGHAGDRPMPQLTHTQTGLAGMCCMRAC